MSRIDIINKALSGHTFINLYNRTSDEVLKAEFDSLTKEEQRRLVELATPRPCGREDCNSQFWSDVEQVAQHYAFRMIGSESLPPFLRRAMLLADDSDSSDVLLLASITVASACLPNLVGSLLDEEVVPNLYTFITGNAASGKGKANLCRHLLDPIDKAVRMVIPGNSSATAMNEALAEYDGRGIIFETEADTLSQAFAMGKGWSSDLRKAFHGETISYRRRTDHEEVRIGCPRLSLFLTGTPSQSPKLLQSAENGLFSRMLFYRLDGYKESFLVSNRETGVTATMLVHYYQALGMELRDLYGRMLQQPHPISFTLTSDQMDRFMIQFNNITNAYEALAYKAYQSDEACDQMTGICRRMGNICYRLLMVLSALRQIDLCRQTGDNGEPWVSGTLSCLEEDCSSIGFWAEMLMHHSLIHYDEMLVANNLVEDDELEPDIDSPDLLNPDQHDFWVALPDKFLKKEAILIAQGTGVQLRTSTKYLELFLSLGILTRLSRGVYRKVR